MLASRLEVSASEALRSKGSRGLADSSVSPRAMLGRTDIALFSDESTTGRRGQRTHSGYTGTSSG